MAKFVCGFCGFSLEKDSKPDSCPYCSKKGGMDVEENAEGLVEGA